MQSIRPERVGSEMLKVISVAVRDYYNEFPGSLVTITSVRMSPDLQIAKVYLTVFGGSATPQDVIRVLSKHAGAIRHYVGSKIRLRNTPELRFFYDDTLDKMDQIQKLIDKAHSEDSTLPISSL